MHILLLTFLIAISSLGSIPSAIRQYRMFAEAYDRQRNGDLAGARQGYALLLARYPDGFFRQETLFNLAGTEYGLHRFQQASSIYSGLQPIKGALGGHASYNRGNALATIAFSNRKSPDFPTQLKQALACYRKALVADPMNTDARINYEIVLRALRVVTPPPSPSSGGGGKGGSGQGASQQKISSDVSRLILDNARQNESQMMRRYFKPTKPRQTPREEQDW